jgi:predicted metal-dependent TIM-barrel fold hydrolase
LSETSSDLFRLTLTLRYREDAFVIIHLHQGTDNVENDLFRLTLTLRYREDAFVIIHLHQGTDNVETLKRAREFFKSDVTHQYFLF